MFEDIRKLCFLTLFLFISVIVAESTPQKLPSKIYYFEINEEIMPAAWRLVKNAVEEAEAMKADYIFIRLNTYGGMVDIADSIRTKLLNAGPVTIVYIDKNAASAGALISIACDSIYMAEGATIGAATVVNQTGEQMPDKYQSYMRGMMRSTAEAQGRDPKIAEGMVDDRIEIPGVTEEGKVITFTTSEAIKFGFCDGKADNIQEVISMAGIGEYEMIKHKITTLEHIISFLVHPMVSSILLMVIFGGIYFELQTPSIGFPLAAAAIAALLYFAPLYLEGLAENWEILLFVAGLILIALEIFVIPGFGVAGISGIIFVLAGLTLSLVQNDFFDFSFTGFDAVAKAFLQVSIAILATIIVSLFLGKNLLNSQFFQKLVLMDSQLSNEGYTTAINEFSYLVGKKGITMTPLRPSGRIEIEGERYDAVTEGGYIAEGEEVIVKELQRSHLIVKPV